MYRSNLETRDKGGAIAAVVAVHAALLFALLHISGQDRSWRPAKRARVLDIGATSATPATAASSGAQPEPKQRRWLGPKNIRSKATPVVAPKPKIVTPPVQQIATS